MKNMKKQVWKETITILLIIAMMVNINGCIERNDCDESVAYEAVDFPLDGIKGDPGTIIVADGKIYIETFNWIENDMLEDKMTDLRLYSANLDGSDLKEIPMMISKGEELLDLQILKDKTLVLAFSRHDEKTGELFVDLVRLGDDGKELQRETISEIVDIDESDVKGIKQDEQGNTVVLVNQKVLIFDKNFKYQCEISIERESKIENIAVTKNGQIVCGQLINKDGGETVQVRLLDIDAKKWSDTYPLEVSLSSVSDLIMDGYGEYDFYYKDDYGVYGYNMSHKQGTKLMDYVASNMTSDETREIAAVGDGRFVGITAQKENENNCLKIVMYKKYKANDDKSCKIITYGGILISDEVKSAAIKFNKTNKKYKIELRDYSDEEDPETKMKADVIAGNAPDIIDLSNSPIDQYASIGLLEDLTPYFENDSEIGTDDIIPSIYESMQIDGKLYYVASDFNLFTLVGRTKDVGSDNGWTYDDLKALLDKKGKPTQLFYNTQKSDVLRSLLIVGINDFIDWEKGDCYFESHDFKDILELANTRGVDREDEKSEDEPDEEELFREGKILFNDGLLFLEDFISAEDVIGEELNYIGYPNKDKQGSYFILNGKVGMYAKSDVKEGAWEFIRIFMTREYQGKTMESYCIPTRQDCFNLMIEGEMATKKYTNELGREIRPREGERTYGNISLQAKPMTKEQAEKYISIVNDTKKSGQFAWTLMDIVDEEAQYYFNGDKSLDETVKIIQNRIHTYINENR